MQTTDMSERGFQKFISGYLAQTHGYRETRSNDYDSEFCFNRVHLFEFIQNTQEDAYDLIQKKGERGFLVRLDRKINEKGVIEVLRKGVKHFDKTVHLFYTQPVSGFNPQDIERYSANIFSVTQELAYSQENANRLDLVIFINGLPIITLELKNAYTHQSVFNGIRQYQNDRDPKEKLFGFARCLVHFAADTDLVYMTTELKGKSTQFLPFNKGLNDGQPFPPYGAGNPVNPNGEKTHYLWEEVLTKDSLSNIIEKFAQVVVEKDEDTQKTTKKLIFPRYHQPPAGEAEEAEETWEDRINALINARKMLMNGSYFAFTATPKNKTLETFGEKKADGKFYPFHLYSMKQAIEEEFILDVLKNYITYRSYYKLIKTVEDNPDYDTGQAQRKLIRYVEGHEYAIAQKARVMVDHFMRDVRPLIRGRAKAMVVTSSILNAIKYKEAFDAYLKELNSPYKAIVAFSGKKKYKGIEVSEADLNKFPDKNNDIPKQFKKDEYKFLIVAEKFQTGFDQPLLHTMYIDKKLAGVHAVQTLSRLNRAYKPDKTDTFILDLVNTADDIREAFEPYYTTTILSEETDPNRLNDLQEALDDYQVYSEADVTSFFTRYHSGADRTEIAPIVDAAIQHFTDDLSENEQIDFKVKAKAFERTYSFLARILDFNNPYWEELWWFLKFLIPKLRIEGQEDFAADILKTVNLDSLRYTRTTTDTIRLGEEGGVVDPLAVNVTGGESEPEFDSLENIIRVFNRRFGDIEWLDADKVRKILLEDIPNDLRADSETVKTIKNSDRQNAKIASDKKLAEFMQKQLFTHTEIYKKFTDDPDFKRRYEEFIFDIVWQQRQSRTAPC